jgi:hypothetical protein
MPTIEDVDKEVSNKTDNEGAELMLAGGNQV